jgi:hypothetical protein
MGQQVKGYRRKAEGRYGRGTSTALRALEQQSKEKGVVLGKRSAENRKRAGGKGSVQSAPSYARRRGWSEEVNPPFQYGWEASGVERTEKEYGKSGGRGVERRKRVEEVRAGEGYETNGRGRKGSRKQGYVVYGEYVKALVRERAKRVKEESGEEQERSGGRRPERERSSNRSRRKEKGAVAKQVGEQERKSRGPSITGVGVARRAKQEHSRASELGGEARGGKSESVRKQRKESKHREYRGGEKRRGLSKRAGEARKEREKGRIVGASGTGRNTRKTKESLKTKAKQPKGKDVKGAEYVRQEQYRKKNTRGGAGKRNNNTVAQGREEEREYGKWEQVQAKRERMLRRYESEVGRKVTRERVNRAEVRVRVGRRPERRRRTKVMASGERPYREKRRDEDKRKEEVRVSKKRMRGRTAMGESRTKCGGTRTEYAEQASVRNESTEWGGAERSMKIKRVGKALRKSRKPVTPKVRSKGRAVVVVLAGVRKRERRRVKRRVRKREGAGRKHKEARRNFVGRRKYQARKSEYGRKGVAHGKSKRAGLKRKRSKRRWGVGVGKRQDPYSEVYNPHRLLRNPSRVPVEKSRQQVRGGYYGYKVTVIGTRDGSRRTKKVVMWMGTVPKSTKGARIGSAEGVAKTSVGTMGVRVEYCYELGAEEKKEGKHEKAESKRGKAA